MKILAFIGFVALVLGLTPEVRSQELKTLPEMNLSISNAEIQLDWYCQFDGVKAIAVQRSTDSVRNFNTIA
ncbi:MAG TPA: hypothetical protein PLP14_02290, partial [Chitinophagaceae bacterium]|nr:hypothetical protein [Chitinophagaceae bacterium]